MDWTDDTIAFLRALWAEGHSTAEIGRRMGISKNAVVGKAHRLQLAARPSPIRRDEGENRRPAPVRRQAPVLAPADLPVERPPVEAVPPAPLRAVAAAPRGASRSMPCCWPIGEPGSPSFRFCDAPAMSGKPYCEAHAQLAYVKVRDRREDAA